MLISGRKSLSLDIFQITLKEKRGGSIEREGFVHFEIKEVKADDS